MINITKCDKFLTYNRFNQLFSRIIADENKSFLKTNIEYFTSCFDRLDSDIDSVMNIIWCLIDDNFSYHEVVDAIQDRVKDLINNENQTFIETIKYLHDGL